MYGCERDRLRLKRMVWPTEGDERRWRNVKFFLEIFLKANESHKKTERGGETMEKETQEIPSAANKLYGEQAKLL